MMNERRYSKDEVRKIFELATTRTLSQSASSPEASGLTLEEIQGIGREVGLEPSHVAKAAAALDSRPLRKSLGQPIEVGRVVHLPRTLTDHEWDQLVAELRSTFRAQGKVTSHGGIREWRNGNLHACIEPTQSGYRLRLGTLKGDATGINALGATTLAAGALVFSSLWLSGEFADALITTAIFATTGIGALVTNVIRLPRWATERQKQMEHIATKVASLAANDPGKTHD